RDHVDALSAQHEGRITGKTPWTSAKMTEGAMPRMLRMILPFRFVVTSVEGTWKLNQNKPHVVRARAAKALAEGNTPAQEIAALMRALPQEG
ncbi:MAG: FMN-binding negative transcriptional regulator, partial [Tabrizicola sp.]|nr:FMN-binding negative transcriptional regulator [Tabrizicola sp.]